MNLNINSKNFFDQIKDSLFDLQYCCMVDRSFQTKVGSHFKLGLKDNKEIYKFGYSLTNTSQFKFLLGVDFDEVKDKLRYWDSEETCIKPEMPFINDVNDMTNGYFFVIEGLLFYKENGYNPSRLYICADEEGKIFGTDLEVKDVNRT